MLYQPINVAIVDDQTLFRITLKNFLSEHKNIDVVIQSPHVPDLLRKLKDYRVQLILMDLVHPDVHGMEAVKTVKAEYPDVKILMLTMCTDLNLLCELLDLGVYGILSKADEPEEVIRAITSIFEQRIYRSKLFTDVMYWDKQHNARKRGTQAGPALNDREKEIIQMLWEEKSNKEIANHLFLSVRSVEKIRQDLKEKLGVKSTVGLLKYAINEKIISVQKSPALLPCR